MYLHSVGILLNTLKTFVTLMHSDVFWSFSFQSVIWCEIFIFPFPSKIFYENLGHYHPILLYGLIEKEW